MKKVYLIALAFASTLAANALTIATNATATMVAPPVINFGPSAAQIAERTAVNTVAMGEFRRIGGVVCTAANAGTTTGVLTTNTTIVAGGTYIATNSITGYIHTNVVAAVTNTAITVQALSVPLTGLTAVDGSVYWLRVPLTRNPVILQARIVSPGAVVTVTDSAGGTTQLASDYGYQLFTGGKALFARYDSTNGVDGASVSIIEQ